MSGRKRNVEGAPCQLALAVIAILTFGCGSKDERPAEFAFIAPVILAPNCATVSCHSSAAAESGLNFSDPDSAYESLLGLSAQFALPGGVSGEGCTPREGETVCTTSRPLVQPCRPDESRLVNMLRARGAELMPPDRPLPLADIELVERWILTGAKRSPSDPTPSCGPEAMGDAGAGGPDAAVTVPDAGTPAPDAAVSPDAASDAMAADALPEVG